MKLSQYQSDIIEWVRNGKGHGCCNAVAGSGKSTTLRLVALALQESGISPDDIRIIVFGKANQQDLVNKFGKEWEQSISTLHSAGWQILKNYLEIKNTYGLIKSNKYKQIARDLGFLKVPGRRIGSLIQDGHIDKESDFLRLIDLVRLTNIPLFEEDIEELCEHFELPDIREFSYIKEALEEILDAGEWEAKKRKSFDFTDQIWLPIKWNLKEKLSHQAYKFVLVDECQDLNAIQLELSLILAGEDGRILAVGDPNQAIFGFAGADCDSYDNIVERLQAKELPLSICYRCPSSHIKLVNKIFPGIPIKSKEDAIEGNIEQITEKDLWSDKPCRLVEGDMVLSRKTAPLVNLCIKLISKGIAATVKGRSIGAQIKAELGEIAKTPNFIYERFRDTVNVYRHLKASKYRGLDNEEQMVELLNDKVDSLIAIYESQPNATSIKDLGDYIDTLFSDEHSPVTLSTAHRAKGLEGERIFILNPKDMPMKWRNQQDWQKEQESNLLYVALTRSKEHLFIVGEPEWMKNWKLQEEEDGNSEESENLGEVRLPGAYPLPSQDRRVSGDENREKSLEEIQEIHKDDGRGEEYADLLEMYLCCDTDLSDRAIALHAGVSAPTVGKRRRKLEEEGRIQKIAKRIARDGREMAITHIGKQKRPLENALDELIIDYGQEEIKAMIKYLRSKL